ncbi:MULTISPECIES: 4'-phosphopantetheinyl transferase superfamily protein [Arthrobacter]|uniref:4'-phosphopantetheinyl transferase superfamily protein n=2 Tax=Arthrobacter TaxID=1663 RepID=A0ABU9KM40_9MICC|nr:4'-phosphopantetheinyl transferase superfamily protein [Arthrobacter sp. YJM1]MDP5227885.1 4'-phosphopantetheinyl transferase superfamily protein [Arthrobacter sp. YJM1]
MRVITWLGSLEEAARRGDLPPLDAREQDRARAFANPGARNRFATLRSVQRRLLAGALGVAPDLLLSDYACPECGPDAGHGRPGYRLTDRSGNRTTPPFALSASRAGEWGAVVVALDVPEGFRLGVDLTLEAEIFDGFDTVALSAAERAWIGSLPPEERISARAGLWAAKEAIAKRDGHGLRKDPSTIEALGRRGLVELRVSAAGPGTGGGALPPHRLMAAVPEKAEAAFRRATA